MNNNLNLWHDNINFQIDFYDKSFRKKRVDHEFDWGWEDKRKTLKENIKYNIRPITRPIKKLFFGPPSYPFTRNWLESNYEMLWGARALLSDDLSRILFDCHLVLSVVGHEKYFFPRFNFEDFLIIKNETSFASKLPLDYIGLPLKVFDLELLGGQQLKVISTKLQIKLFNNYRQYFINRGAISFFPEIGDCVIDCGACIGDLSVIFAAMVGSQGEVHSFDPVSLHGKYCLEQANLNPSLSRCIHFNDFAVGKKSKDSEKLVAGAEKILPDFNNLDNLKIKSIDDYVLENKIKKVDYVKMDIEGNEYDALLGVANVIGRHKPKLAISAYHKQDDLWKIPNLIMELNKDYKIYFGHHNAMRGESVYYAA